MFRCRAMPMPFARWGVDRVSWTDLDDLLPPGLGQAAPLGDMQGLTVRVSMPRRMRPRREPDDAHPQPRRSSLREQ